MPNLDFKYKCSNCGREESTAILLSISEVVEERMVRCSYCGTTNLGKRDWSFSNVGIQFNGPGFYVNDYKKKEEK